MEKQYLPVLKAIGHKAAEVSLKAWAVGGFVRDYYLGKSTADIDICFEGPFEPVLDFCVKKYAAKIEKFAAFGTARVALANGLKLDFVRCRKEVYTQPGALPKVSPSDLKDDLLRRDFTCNAAALSLLPQEFFKSYDYFYSLDAIKSKYIKVLHDKSFYDDPTRIFRALRFAGRLNWKLEKSTQALLQEAVKEQLPLTISRERICRELIKILQEKQNKRIFKLLKQYKADVFFYPNLKIPAVLNKTDDYRFKILLLALAIKQHGAEFLQHLHLPRADFKEIFTAWDVYISKQSPSKPLSKEQKSVLMLFDAKLTKTALEQTFLSGGEIAAAGFKGQDIKNIFNKAAALQWKGKIKTKKEALAMLKEFPGGRK